MDVKELDIKFIKLLDDIFQEETLIKMVISDKRKKSNPVRKVTLRPVIKQDQLIYQIEYTFDKKVTQKNTSAHEAKEAIVQLVQADFKQIDIFTTENDIHVLASKTNKIHIKRKPATKKQDLNAMAHNRSKKYLIPDGEPCDFLIRLGVMTKSGDVIHKHYSKFRQINRFLEIADDVFEYLPKDRTINIVDFGCGKAYLTFALYYYLKILKGRDVNITGLDLKDDVIDFCNQVAKDLKYDELKFKKGDIADYQGSSADMVVTLHACDTATDYALINAVSWNTKVILSVPCCQHQLFKQIKNTIHEPILKHGILKDRLTEYLTDGLRSLKLESKGYSVSLIEFTSLEHTAKNIMIRAVKTGSENSPEAKKAQEEYQVLRDFYNVHPEIDQL